MINTAQEFYDLVTDDMLMLPTDLPEIVIDKLRGWYKNDASFTNVYVCNYVANGCGGATIETQLRELYELDEYRVEDHDDDNGYPLERLIAYRFFDENDFSEDMHDEIYGGGYPGTTARAIRFRERWLQVAFARNGWELESEFTQTSNRAEGE